MYVVKYIIHFIMTVLAAVGPDILPQGRRHSNVLNPHTQTRKKQWAVAQVLNAERIMQETDFEKFHYFLFA